MLLQNLWIFEGNAPFFILRVRLSGSLLVNYLEEHESAFLNSIEKGNCDAQQPSDVWKWKCRLLITK
jgi:hypothetical protein